MYYYKAFEIAQAQLGASCERVEHSSIMNEDMQTSIHS